MLIGVSVIVQFVCVVVVVVVDVVLLLLLLVVVFCPLGRIFCCDVCHLFCPLCRVVTATLFVGLLCWIITWIYFYLV